MRVALAGLGLTTTVRMVDRVHGRSADGRLDAAPAAGAGLAPLLEVVLDVADLADGGAALGRHPAQDRKSTGLNSSHSGAIRMPTSACNEKMINHYYQLRYRDRKSTRLNPSSN